MQVLKGAGLNQGISSDTFVMVAASIDELGRRGDVSEPAHADTWRMALLAAQHLAKNATSLHSDSMYSSLKKLAFVPAIRVRSLDVGWPSMDIVCEKRLWGSSRSACAH